MKKIFYLLLACGMLAISCEKDLVKGEGPVLTENRSTPVFEKITSDGSTKVYISYADTFGVQVKAYASLLPHFQTNVKDGVLELGFRNGVRIKNENTEVYISMPALKGLQLNGSGDSRISGPFPALSSLRLEITGSGTVDASGAPVDKLQAAITGSGSMNLEEIAAKIAIVSISGSGDLRISVSQQLTVDISGSGAVYYRGNPGVSSDISGSGKVVKL